ncbi:MAG: Maf family protein [Acidobacteriia bacterium]|nr:Maf family protein [Terriglobia bacterium]
MRFILASNSPRRQELLRNAGFDFEVRSCPLPEPSPERGADPTQYAMAAGQSKALCIAAEAPPGTLVLAADTVVVLNGLILGKPVGPHDATQMLRLLSGKTHEVITGVCLARAPDTIETRVHEITFVTFRDLDDEEIRDYVKSREPYDKAGAYAIQGYASRFVTRISGCYFNVVGLPVALVAEILKSFTAEVGSRK